MDLIHHNTSHHGVIWRCSLCKKTYSIWKSSKTNLIHSPIFIR